MGGHKIINQSELHFLTLTIIDWVDVFTRPIYRDIIIDSLKYCQFEKGLILNAYVIMSNHIHLIVRTKEGFELSSILRDFKKFTSKKIIKTILSHKEESRKNWLLSLFNKAEKNKKKTYQVWQKGNYPIELESPKWINQKLNYIHLNPVRNKIVGQPEDYLYSSASSYLGKDGLIELEIIDLGSTIE